MAKDDVKVEQLKNESKEDFRKFRVFLTLGVNRSLDQAYKSYYETTSAVPQRWQTIADKYAWNQRAQEYDKTVELERKPPSRR